MDLNKEMKKLEKAYYKYSSAIGTMEGLLSGLTDFDFGILYQTGDGFVIADDDCKNAPLDECIRIIKKEGFLSHYRYTKITI